MRNDRITIPAKQAGTQSEVLRGTKAGEGAHLPGQPVLPPTDDLGPAPDRRPGRPADRNDQRGNDFVGTPQRHESPDRDRGRTTRDDKLAGNQNAGRSGAATAIDSQRLSDVDAAMLPLSPAQDSPTQILTIGQQTAVATTREGDANGRISDNRGENDNRSPGRIPGIQGFTPTAVVGEKAGTIKAAYRKVNSTQDAERIDTGGEIRESA